ncbi:MAG: chemotaxis protein CheB [Desulfococcaceae bacterium]
MNARNDRDILVIGASFGGLAVLRRLLSRLPEDFAAPVFIVQHISPTAETILHKILEANGPLPALLPEDGEKITPGTIYVAPPNRHLLVKKDHVAVVFGPKENRSRPSIDALFRSAAAYHTTRVAAVLLTGYLHDGVSGLNAVKRCGGITLVQDPNEAEAPELPQTAIDRVEIDHVLPLEGIGRKLLDIIGQPAGEPPEVPEEIMEDVKVSEHEIPNIDRMHEVGDQTPYTCPECGGGLWRMKNEPITRYRCHTGHAFSEQSFLAGQAEVIENSLWATIRLVQERIDVLTRMAETARKKNREDSAADLEKKMEEMIYHVRTIRRFILSGLLGGNTEADAAPVARGEKTAV